MNNLEIMFSNKSNEWATPQDLFDELDREFRFTLDPCADETNHKCDRYYTVNDDGLSQDWSGERVFCNPPYGRSVDRWVKKCFEEVYCGKCCLAVMLLFAKTDTKWFHNYIYNKAEIRFLKGRVRFGNQRNDAPFPSMVVIFRGTGGNT